MPGRSRRVLVTALACLASLAGCTSSRTGSAKPSQSSEPPATGASATPTGTTPSAAALSATAIADRLGCTDRRAGQKAATDPVEPVEAIDCTVGDVRYGIRTYRSNAERDEVLEAAPVDSGYRNVGERSLVTTDTESAATNVLQKVGGTIVDTRYTTPGS